jgi:predicted ATPase with chaperone activity
MLASRLPVLLPPLSNQEALESAAILSLVNLQIDTSVASEAVSRTAS